MYCLKMFYFIWFYVILGKIDLESYCCRIFMMNLFWCDYEELKFEGFYEKKLFMVLF